MISEFSAKIKSSNNKAKIIFLVTFALALVTFATSFVIDRFGGLVGNIGLILIAVSMLVYTKYLAPEYYYEISHDSEGASVFVVTSVTGKRRTTLCRINLSEIIRIERETRTERKAHKTDHPPIYSVGKVLPCRKYNYSPTIYPELTYRIYTSGRHERAEIIIEVSDEFADLLRTYAAEARLLEGEE